MSPCGIERPTFLLHTPITKLAMQAGCGGFVINGVAFGEGYRPSKARYAQVAQAIHANKIGYFLLTGTPVFMDRTMIAVCAAHLDEMPERPSVRLGRTVPEDLEKLIMRGLSKRPADRPATAQAFRQALLACDVTKWTEDDAQIWWGTHLREGSTVVVKEARALLDALPARMAISMVDRGVDHRN